MKKVIRILALLVCLSSPLWAYGIAMSAVPDPIDSTPSVSNININRQLLTSGDDILIYGDYNLPYATPPDIGASQAFTFQLIATDNTTELGAITPYVFFDNGYNEGVFSFYFSSMATSNITWGQPYIIRITENPVYFGSPEYVDYVIPINTYTSANTTADNQLELAINIIAAATRLEQYYTSYTMLDTAAAGTVLSSPTGETYFRGVINGIQAMAPDLFMVQVLEYDTEYRTWTTEYSDNLTERFDGTWVGESENATADQFGVTQQSAMGVIPLGGCLIFITVSMMKWRKAEPGFIVSAVLLVMALLMGWVAPAIFATVFQLFGIYIAYLLFLARAS